MLTSAVLHEGMRAHCLDVPRSALGVVGAQALNVGRYVIVQPCGAPVTKITYSRKLSFLMSMGFLTTLYNASWLQSRLLKWQR